MTIISISGKKQSGKDTLAEMISLELFYKLVNKPSVIIGFGDAVKDELCLKLGINRPYLEQNKQHFRLMLQGYGTDYKRNLVDDGYWVERLLKRLNQLDSNVIVIVKDTRFQNEFDSLKRIGAFMVHVRRWTTDISNVSDNHISETELDDCKDFDFNAENDSLEHLKEQAKEIVKLLKL